MRKRRVSLRLRQRITEQSVYRCGYCLTSQKITGARMEIDHIIPESAGGATVEDIGHFDFVALAIVLLGVFRRAQEGRGRLKAHLSIEGNILLSRKASIN